MGLLDSYAPAAKFPTKGTRVGGRVVRDAAEVQCRDFDTGALEVWDDGNPKMQLVVTVDAGVIDPTIEADNGERAIYIKGQMLAATRLACRRAGVREIEEGGDFWVTYTEDEPLPKGKRGYPKKIYEVSYTPPAEVDEAERSEDERASRQAAAMDRLRGQNGAAPGRGDATRKPAKDVEPPF